jgi:hypothetical protein
MPCCTKRNGFYFTYRNPDYLNNITSNGGAGKHLPPRTQGRRKVFGLLARFFPAKAKIIIEEVLTQKLNKIVYDPTRSPELAEELSRAIRTRVKSCTEIARPRNEDSKV